MPTSKQRSGKRLAKRSSPVPDGIAAVIATIPVVALRLGDQRLGEDLRVGRRRRRGALACSPVTTSNFDDAVILVGRRLGRRVALALLGDDVDQDRPVSLGVAHVAQHRQQMVEIVPVDRADVVEAQLLEQGAAGQRCRGRTPRPAAPSARCRAGSASPSRSPSSRSEQERCATTAAATDRRSSRRPAARSTCRCRSGSTISRAASAPALFIAS